MKTLFVDEDTNTEFRDHEVYLLTQLKSELETGCPVNKKICINFGEEMVIRGFEDIYNPELVCRVIFE